MNRPGVNAGERRRRAERAGRLAEILAALYLSLKGFAILERRFRAGGGETDLIARRGRLLVFVEVKRRASLDDAVFAVTPRGRRRIEAAARAYLSRRPVLADADIRYDIMAVAGLRLRHLPGAWRDGE
ncbi:MAG: YraN family protein [Parvularculaceae bacterium]